MSDDFKSAEEIVKDMPLFYLGQKVSTPDGVGIIVKIEMPHNGLYVSPNQSSCIVWFGTSNNQSKWVNRGYKLDEIKYNDSTL